MALADPARQDAARLDALVARARRGDRQAFADLLDQAVPSVRRFLFRLGVRAAALDDLTQEVFVAVLRGFDQYRGEAGFLTWVLGIALNVQRAWRRRQHAVPQPQIEIERTAVDRGPGQLAADHDEVACLRRDLDRLSEGEREAFVLRHVDERSVAQAAVIAGVPEGTLRRRAHAARVSLRGFAEAREVARR